MIGRGIDQILPFKVPEGIHEGYMKSARGYVDIAVRENGPLPIDEIKKGGFTYVWGDLVNAMQKTDCLVFNLETSLTTSEDWAPYKGINYRAHPKNVGALKVAGADIVTLANNHVLDWGEVGLEETLDTLKAAGIFYAGAGRNEKEATRPVVFEVPQRPARNGNDDVASAYVKVLAAGFPSAGVPESWRATSKQCGINFERVADKDVANKILSDLRKVLPSPTVPPESGDDHAISIVSLHWGPNWGWGTPKEWRKFAHELVDGGVDIVVGHSSHHVKGIEVYKGKMIAYGLGDFLNDYEGIIGQGYENYRNDLSCLYLPRVNIVSKKVEAIDIIPCKIKHLRVQRTKNPSDIEWLRSTLSREGKQLGTTCETVVDASTGHVNLRLHWAQYQS